MQVSLRITNFVAVRTWNLFESPFRKLRSSRSGGGPVGEEEKVTGPKFSGLIQGES